MEEERHFVSTYVVLIKNMLIEILEGEDFKV